MLFSISSLVRVTLQRAFADLPIGNEVTDLLEEVEANKGGVANVSFSIGVEAADAIVVSIQALDEDGNDVAEIVALDVLLFDDAAGAALNTDNYTIAAGTDGIVAEVVADKILKCVTEADGDLDVSLTIAGAATSYIGVVMPNGKIVMSGAVTHAA